METMQKEEQKLCVKELAGGLGVSARYVYEMRRCGFRMEGRLNYNQLATLPAARQWIESNNFRIVRGVGRVETAKASVLTSN